MSHVEKGIVAYDNQSRAKSYHEKKGFSPERKVEMLRVTADVLIQISEKSSTLLELGAGTGHLTRNIIGADHFRNIIVTDGAEEMLNIAKKELKSTSETDIIYQLLDFSTKGWASHYEGQNIHAITSSMAIHHVEDKKRLFSEVFRILTPSGTFVFADHMAGRTETIDDIIGTKRAMIKLSDQGKEMSEENIKNFIQLDEEKQNAEGNKCESVLDYMNYLDEVGFQDVDCIWRDYWLAVFVARKPK